MFTVIFPVTTFFISILLSVYYSSQGLGVPTGPHGAFRDYQVDAITLEISPKVSLTKMIRRNEFILRGYGCVHQRLVSSISSIKLFWQASSLNLSMKQLKILRKPLI